MLFAGWGAVGLAAASPFFCALLRLLRISSSSQTCLHLSFVICHLSFASLLAIGYWLMAIREAPLLAIREAHESKQRPSRLIYPSRQSAHQTLVLFRSSRLVRLCLLLHLKGRRGSFSPHCTRRLSRVPSNPSYALVKKNRSLRVLGAPGWHPL